jgi:hypothetical protein
VAIGHGCEGQQNYALHLTRELGKVTVSGTHELWHVARIPNDAMPSVPSIAMRLSAPCLLVLSSSAG